MDLKMIRVFITSNSSRYKSDNTDHQTLYVRLFTISHGGLTVYKLRNNYHLGIL